MKTLRIVKLEHPSGRVEYAIQQRHKLFLFEWWTFAGWEDPYSDSRFNTLEEAKDNMWMFDGSKTIETVVEVFNETVD